MTAVIPVIRLNAQRLSKTSFRDCMAVNTANEKGGRARSPVGDVMVEPEVLFITVFESDTQVSSRRSRGLLTDNDFQTAASIKLKIAAFAPIPKAMVSTATIVNLGDRLSVRTV